jgi:hypothetical protein
MKGRFVAVMLMLLCGAVAASAQLPGKVEKDPSPKPVSLAPDLTITGITWRRKPHAAQITVANVGRTKAAESTGSYGCKGALKGKEYSVGYGSMFGTPALEPNQTWKIVLDCGGDDLTGASVDATKKIVESNEKNNQMSFADVQK